MGRGRNGKLTSNSATPDKGEVRYETDGVSLLYREGDGGEVRLPWLIRNRDQGFVARAHGCQRNRASLMTSSRTEGNLLPVSVDTGEASGTR